MLVSGPLKPLTSQRLQCNPHTCCQVDIHHIPRIHLPHLPPLPVAISPSICKRKPHLISFSLSFPPSLSAATLTFSLSINLMWNCVAWCGLSGATHSATRKPPLPPENQCHVDSHHYHHCLQPLLHHVNSICWHPSSYTIWTYTATTDHHRSHHCKTHRLCLHGLSCGTGLWPHRQHVSTLSTT